MNKRGFHKWLLLLALLLFAAVPATAVVNVQCPGDTNGDAVINGSGDPAHPNAQCMHLAAGDGFVTMADGYPQYMFGFADITGTPPKKALDVGTLAATFPAPPITLDEGDEFFLSLTNVGMLMRPDLFDPHTVHWHGFPEAASVFDGVPDSSISINMGSTLTYYYNVVEPGTYMYHCHVEATEHMQMGMLGNLYVRPAQDGTTLEYPAGSGKTYNKFAYNDGDGSTGYDVDFPIQIGSFDSAFHDASLTVQPLPFAMMRDNYPMLNGRGYPDTVQVAGPDAPPEANPVSGNSTQPESSLVTAAPGQRVLLRISNLNVTRFYTLQTLGVSMQVVGKDASIHRGPDGKDLYYMTNSVVLGGGESLDAIIEIPESATAGTTYFLYTSNLNYLSNNEEDFGGMMTEIRVN
ncbi:MAG: hypothetical protein C0619_04285 [Desulfuromonas sp.]|nr:MAG: hypothetical protein C0619_04285 [Desulfuromonas sp.]